MTHERDEKLTETQFEDYLEGRSRVSQGYERLKDVEPPAALDRAVLEQARAAVRSSQRRVPFWSHWSSRVAVAAVALLAVAVVLRVGVAPPQASFEQALPSRQEAQAPGRVEDLDETGVEFESRRMRLDPAGRPQLADRASEQESAVSFDSPPAAEVRPHESPPTDSQLSALQQTMAQEPVAKLDLGPRAADPSAAVVSDDRQPAAKTVLRRSAPVPEAVPETAAMTMAPVTPTTAEAEADFATRSESADDPTAATIAPVAPTIEEAEEGFAAGSESADDPTAGLTALSAGAPDGQDALRMDTVTVTGSSSRGAPWRDDLESWLAHIDALIDAGDEDGAAEELAEFVEAWPDHVLDERYEPWLPAAAPPRE